MKAGLKVRCIDASGCPLTVGKVYETFKDVAGHAWVRDDEGDLYGYLESRFEVVDEPLAATKPSVDAKQGVKLDTGKPALDLIDPGFVEGVGRVLTFGARKYEPDNWKRGMAIAKVMGGVLRHCFAILRGELRDPETGELHSDHAACGLMFVGFYVRNGMTSVPDDRWQREVAS